jgi:soluble lytic murein transglycosylase-like protein
LQRLSTSCACLQQTDGVLATIAAAAVVLAVGAPAPAAPIPREPAAVANRLEQTTKELHAAIDTWRVDGDPARGLPPRDVQLWALHQQRLFLALTYDAGLGRRAWPLLGREARVTLAARRALVRLTPPTRRPLRSFRTGPPAPAGRLLAWYRKAERRFGVDWQVLAAVNFVESAFGRLRSSSSAGAQGPMQFLPSTWRAYGLGGDVHDPHDAILGAANYLRASGAPRDYRRALHAYNHSTLYVDAVLRYTAQMRRDVRHFYAYYSWQVFIRTPAGPRRITGP